MFEVELAECLLMLQCEYLRPSLSDEDCVLHLGRPPTVLGQVGPAIIQHSDLETLLRFLLISLTYPPVSLTDDRLNGEHHPWYHLHGVVIEAVIDVRGTMEESANTWHQYFM